jgi:alpha-tubulin suppressor-like RCC1 family protein
MLGDEADGSEPRFHERQRPRAWFPLREPDRLHDLPPQDRDRICALIESGDVYCWGHNWFGDIGNGTWHDSVLCPVKS